MRATLGAKATMSKALEKLDALGSRGSAAAISLRFVPAGAQRAEKAKYFLVLWDRGPKYGMPPVTEAMREALREVLRENEALHAG